MDYSELERKARAHVLHAAQRERCVIFERAQGSRLWDAQGKIYLDTMSAPQGRRWWDTCTRASLTPTASTALHDPCSRDEFDNRGVASIRPRSLHVQLVPARPKPIEDGSRNRLIDRRRQTHRRFTRDQFQHDPKENAFRFPKGKWLRYQGVSRENQIYRYGAKPSECGICPLKKRCTPGAYRKPGIHRQEPTCPAAQDLVRTPEYVRSGRERNKIEALI